MMLAIVVNPVLSDQCKYCTMGPRKNSKNEYKFSRIKSKFV